MTPEARQRARIPAALRFQEKWRLALTLLRQIRAAGFQVTAVLGDAEFGDNATLRRTLHRWQLPYALGSRRRSPCFGAHRQLPSHRADPDAAVRPRGFTCATTAVPKRCARSPPACRVAPGGV